MNKKTLDFDWYWDFFINVFADRRLLYSVGSGCSASQLNRKLWKELFEEM